MPIQILMPALSPTMTEGNLIRWLKNEGDAIKAGQVLAEIETDKATMEVEAVDEGTLGRIVVPAGTEGVQVNQLIGLILEEGEDASALDLVNVATPVAKPGGAPVVETKAPPRTTSKSPPAPMPTTAALSSGGRVTASPAAAALASGRVVASPLAKRLASEKGIDIRAVKGSGPHGRVVKADVLNASPTAVESSTPAAVQSTAPTAKSGAVPAASFGEAGFAVIPLNNMRRTIARRLTEAKRDVPHFYLSMDCEIDSLLKMRTDINQHWTDEKISVNDFIIRAVALALKQVPAANVSYHDTVLHQYDACDVSVAVAIEGGLITPVIRSAEKKSLRELSAEMKDLAARARAGKLKPQEFQGGSFSISNLGMYGVNQFAAILNPPQACILAVGAGEQRPVVRGGELTVATMMTCTLSVDHRAVDGALGAELLKTIKELLEAPAALII